MREATGDLWAYPCPAKIITTNGEVNRQGLAIMGRGIALDAATKWPHISKVLGQMLRTGGNHVYSLGAVDVFGGYFNLYSFPTKNLWRNQSDIELIRQSAIELSGRGEPHSFVLPRPGCGNGGLKWENVKPVLEPILDDRFIIVSPE